MDLIFFPEIQLSPFFPQYEERNAVPWLMRPDGPELTAIRNACQKARIYASPNLYLELEGERNNSAGTTAKSVKTNSKRRLSVRIL